MYFPQDRTNTEHTRAEEEGKLWVCGLPMFSALAASKKKKKKEQSITMR